MKWFKKNWLWLLINLLALLPIINLVSLIETSGFPKLMVNYPDGLLENPALKGKEITPFWFPIHSTGEWAIKWLTFSLICTPLNILFGWKQILKVRKTTGLWAFTYSLVHVLFFIWERNLLALFEEVKFILGLISFSIMLPLALTSNKKSHRHLKKTWVKLHRYAYVAGILAVIHVILAERGWELYAILISIGFVIRIPSIKKLLVEFRNRNKKHKPTLAQ